MESDNQTTLMDCVGAHSVGWRTYPYHLSAGLLRDERGGAYRLTVEAAGDGAWEWLAWSAHDPNHCLDGRARSLCEARRAAEQAGRGLSRIVNCDSRLAN